MATRSRLLGACLLSCHLALTSACLYVGGGVHTTIDAKSGEPTLAARGHFGGFTLRDLQAEELEPTDERSGVYFGLSMGVSYDKRLDQWAPLVGPRIGWLWPHGYTELGFEPSIVGERPSWAFVLTLGPRFELNRREDRYQRTATAVSVPATVGLSFGDGLRPSAGLGLELDYFTWSRSGRYY